MEILIIKKDFSKFKKIHSNLGSDVDIPHIGDGCEIVLPIDVFIKKIDFDIIVPNPIKYGLGNKLNKEIFWNVDYEYDFIKIDFFRNNNFLDTRKYHNVNEVEYFFVFENFIIPSFELGSVHIYQTEKSHDRYYNFIEFESHFDVTNYKVGE